MVITVMHSTVKTTYRIIDKITSPVMLTKTISVIFTKYKLLISAAVPIFRIPTKRSKSIFTTATTTHRR